MKGYLTDDDYLKSYMIWVETSVKTDVMLQVLLTYTKQIHFLI
jgi:hypothetical protein